MGSTPGLVMLRTAADMKVSILLLLLSLSMLLATAMASTQARVGNTLTCSICVDVVTDVDEWLTCDKTEQEIVELLEEVCTALGFLIADFEERCKELMESMLPSVIDALVNQNLDPATVCTDILHSCP